MNDSIKNPLTDQEFLDCFAAVEALDPASLTSADITVLRDVFYNSTYYKLCEEISIKLVEAEDEDFYPILIAKMRTLLSGRYLWTLMLRASSWDCSRDLDFFVDILILRKDNCVILAKEIINDMEDIDDEDRKYAISKLTLYHQTIVIPDIKSAVESVFNFLTQSPVDSIRSMKEIYNPKTNSRYDVVMRQLNELDTNNLSAQDLVALTSIFVETTYSDLREEIAIKMAERGEISFLPILMKKLRDVVASRNLWSLIVSAKYFDCSEYLPLFVDIVILQDNYCDLEAATAIAETMKDIKEVDRKYAIEKLQLCILNTIDEKKRSIVAFTLSALEQYPYRRLAASTVRSQV